MRVLTVGGGLYGIVAALKLDRAGHDVTLYEKERRLMRGATGANQFRLHRGYHYPRSAATARECRDDERAFRETFPEAVLDGADHYYCIASEGSQTSPDAFLAHCDRLGLPYERADHPTVGDDAIDLCVRVPEARVGPEALRDSCLRRLSDSDVRVVRNRRAEPADLEAFDATVVATYADIDALVADRPGLRREYKFELCEKPLVSLPSRFHGTSTVVMDGPFMCYDPYGTTDRFLLGNVVHAVHDRSVGYRPDVDERYEELLFEGLVRDPPRTRFDRFVEHGSEFVPGLAEAEHHGSFFTVRAVLPDVEDTDARRTHVDRAGDVFTVFAGKLGSCLDAADEVVDRLGRVRL